MFPFETTPLLLRPKSKAERKTEGKRDVSLRTLIGTVVLFTALLLGSLTFRCSSPKVDVSTVQQCAIDRVLLDTSYLDDVEPIQEEEFIARKDRLAQGVARYGYQAFRLDIPSEESEYYLNISTSPTPLWTVGLILPSGPSHKIIVLTVGHFDLPAGTQVIPWNYSETYLREPFNALGITNDFIGCPEAHGPKPYLTHTSCEDGHDILVPLLKTPTEMRIIRAVHDGSRRAVVAVRGCLPPGMAREDVAAVLNGTVKALGFEPVVATVSGRTTWTGRALGVLPRFADKTAYDDALIIHLRARYYGYTSRLTRTVLIDPPSNAHSDYLAQKGDFYANFHRAQSLALELQAATVKNVRQTQSERGTSHWELAAKLHDRPGLESWWHWIDHLRDDGEMPAGWPGLQTGMVFSTESEVIFKGVRVQHGDAFFMSEDWDGEALAGSL